MTDRDDDFTWTAYKAGKNLAKHGVSFEEALTVLDDAYAIIDADLDERGDERLRIIGMSEATRVLFVVTAESNLSIVSARKANTDEKRDYENTKAQQIGLIAQPRERRKRKRKRRPPVRDGSES